MGGSRSSSSPGRCQSVPHLHLRERAARAAGGNRSARAFNEPGPRTASEGGRPDRQRSPPGASPTTLEMPLNASPPTTTVQAFDEKLAAANAASRVDFGLWGGIVPGNLDELPGLAQRGVCGFKAFMSSTGMPDFPRSDELTLYEAMWLIAGLPSAPLVAVHAESETITRELARRARFEGRLRSATTWTHGRSSPRPRRSQPRSSSRHDRLPAAHRARRPAAVSRSSPRPASGGSTSAARSPPITCC